MSTNRDNSAQLKALIAAAQSAKPQITTIEEATALKAEAVIFPNPNWYRGIYNSDQPHIAPRTSGGVPK